MKRFAVLILLAVAVAGIGFAAAQQPSAPMPPAAVTPSVPVPPKPTPAPTPAPTSAPQPAAPVPDDFRTISDTVSVGADGLTLPADFQVQSDEGLVKVKAECSGPVQWYVFGSAPIKSETAGNTVVVSVPDQEAQIVVLATGLLLTRDDKGAVVAARQTPFIRCIITVVKPKPPAPKTPSRPQASAVPPAPVAGKLYVVIVEDPNARTQAVADVLNSTAVRKAVEATGGGLKVVDGAKPDPWLAQKGLTQHTAGKALPLVLVQDAQGTVRDVRTLPGSEAEVLEYVARLTGK